MCGIAGFYTPNEPLPAAKLEAMASAISHRGPDDQGFFGVLPGGAIKAWKQPGEVREPLAVGLGFRRLAILDLSENGAQPMRTPDGRYTLAFNGEIYNFPELKAQLGDVTFRSQSDTEVLLHYLVRFGLDALPRLNGIFAFAFHDREKRELLLVRDPLGIKPLYYTREGGGIFFSSEVRSLLAARGEAPRLRRELLARYLVNNWIPDPDTLFEGILRVEPGHFLKIGPEGISAPRRYWDFRFAPDESLSLAAAEEALEASLSAAIQRQIRSDVPVAFFLSGGVDSSLLAARASRLPGVRPTTFTIGFKWARTKLDNLDLESARRVKDKFPFDYREIILDPAVVSLLPKVVSCLEEPIADPAALCSYLICQEAGRDFRVILSGQGGDELFGGYPVYQAGWMAAQLQRMPSGLLSLFHLGTEKLPYSLGGRRMQSAHRLRKILYAAGHPWPDSFSLLRAAMRVEEAGALLSPETAAIQEHPLARQRELFESAAGWDVAHQMLYLDSKTYLPALNLAYSDKTSMAHSVELRVPFLDAEIVELVQRLPSRLKFDVRETKILLKRVAERILPREVVYRRKAGFGLPLRDWFLSDLQPMAADLLGEERLRRQGILNPELPARWLREHRDMVADHSMRLYSLMTLQLWLDSFGVRV